jgi:hypothetical protein
VLFLTKVSAALAHVDGSSGAIGTAVNRAIGVLVPIIARATEDEAIRGRWLDQLWRAESPRSYTQPRAADPDSDRSPA